MTFPRFIAERKTFPGTLLCAGNSANYADCGAFFVVEAGLTTQPYKEIDMFAFFPRHDASFYTKDL